MSAKWKQFSKEQLEEIVKDSKSIAEVAHKIGYAKNSGSFSTQVKKMIEFYEFDTSHFLRQEWNKNNFDYSRFRKGVSLKNGTVIQALTFKRGHRCECCGLSTWNDVPIPLQVHHKDGDRLNYEEDNLELLCPNCHALTDSYCGKNIKDNKIIEEQDFVKALQENKNIRQALLSLGLTPKAANYSHAYELIIKYNINHLIKE